MCTAHVLMRFCHLIDHSFVCKAREGHHVRIYGKPYKVYMFFLPILSNHHYLWTHSETIAFLCTCATHYNFIHFFFHHIFSVGNTFCQKDNF